MNKLCVIRCSKCNKIINFEDTPEWFRPIYEDGKLLTYPASCFDCTKPLCKIESEKAFKKLKGESQPNDKCITT